MILYKYRGFANMEFALDIFVRHRLYAAKFEELNDPMEGRFVFAEEALSKRQLREIRGKKAKLRIVSLSKTARNLLMWSHYADGHTGFVVGVELKSPTLAPDPIRYRKSLPRISDSENAARRILTTKLRSWKYEEEQRVLVADKFVDVAIRELIFGINTPQSRIVLLRRIAKKFCPDISVRKLTEGELETGRLPRHEI